MTKFTIITPVYNGEKYISTCIEAIASINYDLGLIEHIIVDDGSKDNTKAICLEYEKKYNHIKFYSKPNGNWGSVINFVKTNRLATGDYIFICDADDAVMPGAFADVDKKIQKLNQQPDLFSGSFYLWNGKKRKIKVSSYLFLFKKLLIKKRKMNYFSPLLLPFSTMIKTDIFYKIEDLKEGISYQDSILLVNAFLLSKTIGITKKGFSKYWKTRPNNTMSQVVNEKGIRNQLINFEYFSHNDLIEPFFYGLLGLKQVKKYIKQNKLRYPFANKKPDLTGYPWWARWALKLIFETQIKKLVK